MLSPRHCGDLCGRLIPRPFASLASGHFSTPCPKTFIRLVPFLFISPASDEREGEGYQGDQDEKQADGMLDEDHRIPL